VRLLTLRTRVAATMAASLTAAVSISACSDGSGPAEVASVVIAGPSSTTLQLNFSLVLTASARDAGGGSLDDRAISWVSDHDNVVNVKSTGPHTALVTALAPGAAVVTARSGQMSAAVTISVRVGSAALATSISITPPASPELDAGGALGLVAVPRDSAGQPLAGVGVSWSSSDTNTATVASVGATAATVRGKAAGTVTIKATVDGQMASVTLTVRPSPLVTIRIDPPNLGTLSLPAGESVALAATVINLLGQPVFQPITWSSSNPAVATVNPATGSFTTVVAVGSGTTTIVASADGLSQSVTVTVPTTRHAFLWTAANGMTDLGSLPGYVTSDAYAVNATGVVVGTLSGSGTTSAFRWSQGTGMQPLAGLPGGVSTAAVGINASGQVVGYSGNRAVLWSPAGAILDLGTLPGAVGAAATAINDLGQVAGYSYSAGGFRHAFLWTEAGGMQDLGVSLGLTSSSATAISQTAVVGTSDNLGFRWTAAGGMQSLPIRAAASTGKASGVNDAGVVVGSEASPGSYNNCGYYCYYYNTPLVRSVEWSSTGERVDISASGGFVAEDNEALGINNNGQVVGRNHSHGYLWSQSAGLVDVGVLPGRSSSTATAINDNGQVVGSSW